MSIEQKIQKNISLASFSTFKIGGMAEFFIEIKEKEEIKEIFEWAEENKKEVSVLGGGSNVLINSQGVNGIVLKINNNDIVIRSERLDCGAGVSLARAIRVSIGNNLTGLEWATGIPGATIGGAVRGNAGACNFSTSEIVETVEAFNIKSKKFEIFSNKDCEFNYRNSFFSKSNDYLIWNVILKLKKDDSGKIKERIEKNLNYRNKFQPKLPNAGSVFKNLTLKKLQEFNPELAKKAIADNAVKDDMLGAGWIIDLAGLKGKKIGDAKVSLEHANFIINTGKASSDDIIMLISYIKQQIRNKFKVQLQEEIQYIGF